MCKLFILLFIIFIINYFLLGVNEHYKDITNINVCDLHISNIHESNKATLTDIQKSCPNKHLPTTTPLPTHCNKTKNLDFLNGNGNSHLRLSYKQKDGIYLFITLYGQWGNSNSSIIIRNNAKHNTNIINEKFYNPNVVTEIYSNETYPDIIDKAELGGYLFQYNDNTTILFKSCNTLYYAFKIKDKITLEPITNIVVNFQAGFEYF